jgi:hypothetical protein
MGVLWYRHRFAGCAADPESSMATPAQAIGRRMEIGILRHFHRNAFFNGAPISALALPAATIVAFDDEPVLRNHHRVAGLVCGAKPAPTIPTVAAVIQVAILGYLDGRADLVLQLVATLADPSVSRCAQIGVRRNVDLLALQVGFLKSTTAFPALAISGSR